MRVLTLVGVALVGGAAALQAQHSHQLEFGGFGTYTRYDPAFHINPQVGGGARMGFFFGEYFGLEADFTMNSPTYNNPAGVGTAFTTAGASLLINSGGTHNVMYVLAGYERARLGGYNPYQYYDQLQGGIGDRIFFGRHVALRLDVRGYYMPGDQLGNGKTPLNAVGSVGLSFLLGGGGGPTEEIPEMTKEKRDSIIAAGGKPPPQEKPSKSQFVESRAGWVRQWFWGGQAGVIEIQTDEGTSVEPMFGGHWLITAKRTALYVAYEEMFALSTRHATIQEPSGTVEPSNVAFSDMRRIMAGVLAFPVQKPVQPFGGLGFAIMEVLHPAVTCTGCSPSDIQILQDAASAAATKAFVWVMGGLEARQGRLTIFGHYILTTAPAGFLLRGNTNTFMGGLRYSLGSSREGVTDRN